MFEIIFTCPQDPRLARAWPADAAGYAQGGNDTLFVVIRPQARPEAVTAICARFGLDAKTAIEALRP